MNIEQIEALAVERLCKVREECERNSVAVSRDVDANDFASDEFIDRVLRFLLVCDMLERSHSSLDCFSQAAIRLAFQIEVKRQRESESLNK